MRVALVAVVGLAKVTRPPWAGPVAAVVLLFTGRYRPELFALVAPLRDMLARRRGKYLLLDLDDGLLLLHLGMSGSLNFA